MDKLTGYHTLSPAYGRDYQDGELAAEAFTTGRIWEHNCAGVCERSGGRYCSVRDFAPGATVQLRYRQQRNIKVVKVKEGQE